MILKDFQEMINQTIFCVSGRRIEAGREVFEVYLEKTGGKLTLAATDNYRLGVSIRAIGDDFPDFDGVFISAAVLRKIAERKRNTALLSISVSRNEVSGAGDIVNFYIGSACVSVKAIPSEFFHLYSAEDISRRFSCIVPVKVMGEFIKFYRKTREFGQFLPLSFTVARSSLLQALKMVMVMSESWSTLKIDISPGKMALFTEDDNGSSLQEIPCDYSGDTAEMFLHAQLFMDIINHTGTENIKMRFNTQKSTLAVLPEPEQGCYYFLAQKKRG